MIQLLKLATIGVLLLLPATAQTTDPVTYQIPSTGCGVYIDQCVIYWPGELMSLNESQHQYQPQTPPSSWSIFNIDSYSSSTGFTLLHSYNCPSNTTWTFANVAIGTVKASCSGTDTVTSAAFTMTYTINAYRYATRAGYRWWVTGGTVTIATP